MRQKKTARGGGGGAKGKGSRSPGRGTFSADQRGSQGRGKGREEGREAPENLGWRMKKKEFLTRVSPTPLRKKAFFGNQRSKGSFHSLSKDPGDTKRTPGSTALSKWGGGAGFYLKGYSPAFGGGLAGEEWGQYHLPKKPP